ncbi:disease resistance protein RPM1-like [Thalictrum thalictroides]|uniref:Disease resistance protein RPM1-like n=1 Tax=Thalictrum thalictroides TaxID=46969 RepID=A0A7J6W044_THATH|nr:disease resistance protein RPM1-like [Thalictrum thalictroides]
MLERKRAKKCRIHDLMREFIIAKARDQNLATIIAEKQEELRFLSSDHTTGQRPPRLMSISCLRHQDTGKNILSDNNTSGFHLRIRSLYLFMPYKGSWLARSSSTTIFSSFRLLRVLDLQDAGLEEFPSQIVSLLYLRYLSLRRDARITSLPNLVGDLVHLETLDLEYTKLRELPVGILKLRRVCHLLIEKFYTHYSGVKLPMGIDNFINLEKLAVVDADMEESGLLVEELGKLNPS